MKLKTARNYFCLAAMICCTAGTAMAQVRNTVITFSVDMATNIALGTFTPGTDAINVRGTYNNWDNAQTVLSRVGTSTVYTNTVTDTTDVNGVVFYIFNINGSTYEQTADYNNRAAYLPAASNALSVVSTPYFADNGAAVSNNVTFQVDMSQQINLGNFTPGTGLIEVRGNFQGWSGGSALTNDPTIKRTNQYGLVTSNVYVGTLPVVNSPNSANDYKFVENNNFESVSAANADGGGNRFFMNTGNQILPVVDYNDSPFAPIAQVTFNVDMTVVAITDTNFDRTSVTLNGDFNGWSTPVAMTNNPSGTNTNVFSAVLSIGEGSSVNYQYRYNELGGGGTVYDHVNGANGGNNNRYLVVPAVTNYNIPLVVFNDAQLSDYFTNATAVFFSIDMNGAVGTDSHAFNPSSDNVYINGQFANWYAWAGGVNPVPAPAGYQMVEQGLTTIYTNTIIIPAGIPVAFNYKYGIDINGANGGPADDEAGFGLNHYRVVRNLQFNPYVMARDTFGNTYGEPFFTASNPGGANLTINGSTNAGKVAVSWLGRPGARLQYTTNLVGGTWTEIAATDGNTWTNGYASTNGFVSLTNFTSSGSKTFFRMVKH